MKDGYIKIARAIEDWRWANDPTMVFFWVRILIMANWQDKEWRDKVIKRGTFITTVSALSSQLNLSTQQVRTCLDRLRAGGEVKTKTTNTHTIVTICKYDDYQCAVTNEQQTKNKPSTNEKQTNNKRITTTKEYKEDYNTSDTNVSSYSNQEIKKEKKEGDADASPKKRGKPVSAPSDFSFVLELWNSSMTGKVPKIRELSPARKEKVKLRIGEMGGADLARETLRECFKKINESDFCNGKGNTKWVATFDWFFSNEKNWLKTLEGNYDNQKQQSRIEQYADTSVKFHALLNELYGASNKGTADGFADSPDEQ